MNDKVIKLFKKANAIITDSHFVFVSGRHSDTYVNKDRLYPHTTYASKIGKFFAEKYKDENIDVVAAPALGGIILTQWTAYHLSKLKKEEILSVYTEKTPDEKQLFFRGYDKLVDGKNVLVVEDTTTTGGSIKKVIKSVRAAGGNVVAACSMINRDPKYITSESIGAPFSSLAVLEVPSYEPSKCPLCKSGVPINTQVGHGKKFLAAQKNS